MHNLAKENASGKDPMELMMPPRIKQTQYIIKINLIRVEHMAPLDPISNSCDPFVKIRFSGVVLESKVVKSNRNPV